MWLLTETMNLSWKVPILICYIMLGINMPSELVCIVCSICPAVLSGHCYISVVVVIPLCHLLWADSKYTGLLWVLPCGSQPPAPVFNRCDSTGLILALIKNTQCQAPVAALAAWWSLLCLCTPSVLSLITGTGAGDEWPSLLGPFFW